MSTPQRGPAGVPDLGKLEEAYELQSELGRGRATATFAARHREHGRDVTLTVLEASTPAERNALTHLAADARMLTSTRHPHVIPIVEARWLAANRLAIARARVRGSTLRQTLDAVGPLPEARVVEVLRDVAEVLQWASRSGVVHRHVESDCVCFQQGSSNVMVSFGLPASLEGEATRGADDTAFLFERCADGATLARLAYEMLTAHQAGDASVESLRAVRPDAPPELIAAVEAGLRCGTAVPALDAGQFAAMLGGGAAPVMGAGAIATAASAPVVPRGAATPVPPAMVPVTDPAASNVAAAAGATPSGAAPSEAAPAGGAATLPRSPARSPAHSPPPSTTGSAAAYATPRRRRGRGLLIASVLGLVLLIGGTFYLISRDRDGGPVTRVATADRASEEAGDVDVPTRPLPPDPGGLTTDDARSAPAPETDVTAEPAPEADVTVEPAPEPPVATAPVIPRAETPTPVESAPPPVRRAPVVTPREPRAERTAPRNACDSPVNADQRQCLADRIETNDRELTSVYQALLRSVEERSGEGAAEAVRSRQRAWLEERDRECRGVGSGDLWARPRAACLARVSNARARELARQLARVRSGLR